MSIHNVDEILWLTGQMPQAALAIGSNIYSHALTTCKEILTTRSSVSGSTAA